MNITQVKKYFWNVLIAIDQFFNALFFGDPDETISSRAAKLRGKKKWADILCYFLDKVDTNHSSEALELDEGKDQIL